MAKVLEFTCNDLAEIMDWIRNCLKETPLSLNERKQVELALEEAVVNIFTHAYGRKKENIEIVCRLAPQKIEFNLRDRGKAFDPLSHKPYPVCDVSLEEREEGGLGILLMHAYLDELHYCRQGEYNLLTLIKYLAQ